MIQYTRVLIIKARQTFADSLRIEQQLRRTNTVGNLYVLGHHTSILSEEFLIKIAVRRK